MTILKRIFKSELEMWSNHKIDKNCIVHNFILKMFQALEVPWKFKDKLIGKISNMVEFKIRVRSIV